MADQELLHPLAASADDTEAGEPSQQPLLQYFEYSESHQPVLQLTAKKEFFVTQQLPFNNFTKGVEVSPDGLCLLTNSEDHVLRLFDVPDPDAQSPVEDYGSTLQAKEGGTVYDFAWYPFMNSSVPESCIFISTSRDHPVHMWDAYNGQVRRLLRLFMGLCMAL